MHQLDNPVWQALNSADSHFNLGNKIAGYFPAEVSPFAALPDWNNELQKVLYGQLPANRSWSVMIADPVILADQWQLVFTTNLYQMVCEKLNAVTKNTAIIRSLQVADVPAMLELTALTRPGPFHERTIEFGNYHGIFEEDNLVAMAGERLHLDDFTEISAVCTRPGFTGKGYAASLIGLIAEKMIAANKAAFLHVRCDNENAIRLYEKIGFTKRREMYFAVFKRKA